MINLGLAAAAGPQHVSSWVSTARVVQDPSLSHWVQKQREFKKKLDRGDPNAQMTVARAARLEPLSFTWVCLERRQK